MRSFLRWLKLVLVVSSVMPMVILVCSGFEQGGWPFTGLVLISTALAALGGLVLLIAMAPRALIAVAPILAALALVPIVLNAFQIEANYLLTCTSRSIPSGLTVPSIRALARSYGPHVMVNFKAIGSPPKNA